MSGFNSAIATTPFSDPWVAVEACTWTFWSLAVITTCGRFYIRSKHGRLKLDDFFNGLALGSLTAFAAINEVSFPIEHGQESEAPWAWTYDAQESYLKYGLANSILGWLVLYFVKASILALVRSIFGISKNFRRVWLLVVAYTFLTAVAILFSLLWECGDPSSPLNGWACTSTDIAAYNWIVRFRIVTAGFALALHISSDIFILTLPLVVIKRLQVSKGHKIGIAAVFTLAFIDVIAGIIRSATFICTVQSADEGDMQMGCLYGTKFMTICEPCIAVIACALPAYGILLPTLRKRRNQEMRVDQNRVRGKENAVHTSTAQLTEEGYFIDEQEMNRMGAEEGSDL